MIIDGLPVLASPASGDEIPIERGTTTYKIDYDALASAIIAKLGGDPVTLQHGGTGANTVAGAMANLGMLCDSSNKQTFVFENLNMLNDNSKFKYGLLFGGDGPNSGFVYHVFISVDGIVSITAVSNNSNVLTFTGSVSGTTLTLTANGVAYGGIRLIWINY